MSHRREPICSQGLEHLLCKCHAAFRTTSQTDLGESSYALPRNSELTPLNILHVIPSVSLSAGVLAA